MKKAMLILLAAMMVFAMVSCGSEAEATPEKNSLDLPDWFIMAPQADDALYGLGIGESSDLSMAKNLATAHARADIAKQVSVSVQTMLTDYFQEAGIDGDTQAIKFVESISKEVADIELSGATTKQMEFFQDGETFRVFALVEYPLNNFIEEQVADVFERNESAEFAEFKADQALERLNAELDNNPPSSSAQDEETL